MSADHFHVHGPHDHEVEHAASSGDPFAGRIAVMTAILATIGALFGYMEGATQNDALMFKNEAAIHRPRRRTSGISTRRRAASRTSPSSERRSRPASNRGAT